MATKQKSEFIWETKFTPIPILGKEDEASMKILEDFAKKHPELEGKKDFDPKFDRYEKSAFYYKHAYQQNAEKLARLREDVAIVLLNHAKAYSGETTKALKAAADWEAVVQANSYELYNMMRRSFRDWRSRFVALLNKKEDRERLLKEPNCTKLLNWDSSETVLAQNTSWDPSQLVPKEDVRVQGFVGKGAFGIVNKAIVYGNQVAMKVLNFAPVSENMTSSVTASVAKGKALGDFQKECMLLSKLDHPNILKFMGACFAPPGKKEDDPFTALLTEFAENGSLADVLYSSTGVKLSFNRKMKILEEIVQGMNYLHDRPEPILHLDIKPHNILLDSYFHARIADFGMSRIANPQFMASTLGTFVGGTPLYMAPEVMPRETPPEYTVSTKSDVYSFGILLNEMILEDAPYYDNRELLGEKKKTFEQLIKVVTSGETPGVNRPTIVKDNHPLREMVMATWATNPEQRKSFKQFAEEKPWETASIFYYSAGTPKTDIITKKFESKSEMRYWDWVLEIADLYNVKPILQVHDDCHVRALTGLLRIGNALSDNISAADSTLFLRWVADVSTTDNELTCVVYGTVLEPWFWGKFSGDEAHTLLSNPVNNNKPGNYLVRWDGGWVLSYIAKNEEKKLEVKHEPLDSKIITLKQLGLVMKDKKYQKKAKTPATPHIFDNVRIKEKYVASQDGCYVTSDRRSDYRNKNYVYLM